MMKLTYFVLLVIIEPIIKEGGNVIVEPPLTIECMDSLSCTSISTQLIQELKFPIPTGRKLSNEMEARKNNKDGCVKEFIACTDDIAKIADILHVSFNFECVTSPVKEVCDIWDFFDIYFHCNATGNAQLLRDEKLWMEDKCQQKAGRLNSTCRSSCSFDHTFLNPQPIEEKEPSKQQGECGGSGGSCIESALALIKDLGLSIDTSVCGISAESPTTTTTTTPEPPTITTTTPTTTTTTTTPTTTTPTTDFPIFSRRGGAVEATGGANQQQDCDGGFSQCSCLIALIGETLGVKFHYECDVIPKKEAAASSSCHLWSFFELYLLCNATATEKLLPGKDKLWDQAKCDSRTKELNACCPATSSCEFSHKNANPCKDILSPNECINNPACGYCFDPCYCAPDGVRCNTNVNLDIIGCKIRSLVEAANEPVDIDTTCNNGHNKTIFIAVGPGQKKNVTFAFQRQKFPLDFYYLMDFTRTMEDDRIFLERMAPSLVAKLESLTSDLRIGFGSFLDKPVAPFGNPAQPEHRDKGYAYKNSLPLTNQTGELQKVMKRTETIGVSQVGVDHPEDAADGLIQAAECTKEIGWRADARRIILVATDEEFHIARESAKKHNFNFASPYIPGCYLDSTGKYTKELEFDYPSIAQIGEATAKSNIRVIFAVDKKDLGWYNSNMSPIKGSAIATLSGDSSNIIDIVTQTFLQFDSKLELEKSDTTDTVKFRFFSNCAKKDAEETETKICDNLTPEGQVKFTVEVDMAECPKDKSDTETKVSFNPIGIPDFKELAIAHVC